LKINKIEKEYIIEELTIILDLINKDNTARAVGNLVRLIKNLENYGDAESRNSN